MSFRLAAVLAVAFVAAALPLNAMSDDLSSAVMGAKGFDFAGPNSPPDLIDSNDIPTIGDAAAGATGAMTGHTINSVQVNDPNLDHIQAFPGTRPFEFAIQSETSSASFGNTVVVGFNNSADQPIVQTPRGLAFVHRFLSAVGVSHDGGQTWTESSLPAVAGSPFTFGDPALTVDRSGNFYYASLGANAAGQSNVFVSKSGDGGNTFQTGVTVALDPGADKEWIASGPDPLNPSRDNVYVTWTSFKAASSQLMLGTSRDGGQTFSISTLFAPVDNGVESSFIQFSNPIVDRSTGRLYVPFLHGGDGSADYIKVLISDDGGQTFHFSNFNAPGAPEPTAFPVVTPGTLADCGVNGGFRTVLHSGPDLGGGRFGLPVFRNATRLITQPGTVATAGKVFLVFNASNSPNFGDPNSTSAIDLLVSPNGGGTWQGPFTIAAATAAQPQHVHPTVSVDQAGAQVTMGYYAQLASGQLQVFATTANVGGAGQNVNLNVGKTAAVSPAFDLIPSNNPVPALGANITTNFDRTIRPCYDIGEYMSSTRSIDDRTVLSWGDNRNSWTSPPTSPAAGTHSQPDVFAARTHTDD
jgi:hypothetical protein